MTNSAGEAARSNWNESAAGFPVEWQGGRRLAMSTSEGQHTCQLYVFWTESPSFSSYRKLRPRRLKYPSFER